MEPNDHDEPGIYVDIVLGEPLFSSLDKFDSDRDWSRFTKPLEPANVDERPNQSHGMSRTDVRSIHGDSHLGHVFDDGSKGTGGLRYCINSASLRFIPLDDLKAKAMVSFVHCSRLRRSSAFFLMRPKLSEKKLGASTAICHRRDRRAASETRVSAVLQKNTHTAAVRRRELRSILNSARVT
jgi:methionine-R-sulfoxide reductase